MQYAHELVDVKPKASLEQQITGRAPKTGAAEVRSEREPERSKTRAVTNRNGRSLERLKTGDTRVTEDQSDRGPERPTTGAAEDEGPDRTPERLSA